MKLAFVCALCTALAAFALFFHGCQRTGHDPTTKEVAIPFEIRDMNVRWVAGGWIVGGEIFCPPELRDASMLLMYGARETASTPNHLWSDNSTVIREGIGQFAIGLEADNWEILPKPEFRVDGWKALGHGTVSVSQRLTVSDVFQILDLRISEVERLPGLYRLSGQLVAESPTMKGSDCIVALAFRDTVISQISPWKNLEPCIVRDGMYDLDREVLFIGRFPPPVPNIQIAVLGSLQLSKGTLRVASSSTTSEQE